MKDFTYQTVTGEATAEFKDRGSKFIGYVFPVDDTDTCKEKIKAIKNRHPKANHHCFAYRIGTTGLVFRSSDNGEPSGTAGRPILGQIDHFEVTNVLVIAVRYFGGTLLGVRGLINAYKTTAALALEQATVITKNIEKRYRLSFDYTQLNSIHKIIQQYDCNILQQDMQLFCLMEIGIPILHHQPCLNSLNEIKQLELTELE